VASEKIQKIISSCGVCSRRKAESLIESGKIKVNGKTAKIGDRADISLDEIQVNGHLIGLEKRAYYMLHKPEGYVCSKKSITHKTIFDLENVKKIKERVYNVGRLDKETSGLLILTNDGDFSNKIMHPSNEIKKTYSVKTDKKLTYKDAKKIEKGIFILGRKTSKAKISNINDKNFELTIHEGRNRIVRRILDKLGYDVVSLKRINDSIYGTLSDTEYVQATGCLIAKTDNFTTVYGGDVFIGS
jgi:pseudouridine synthase